MSNNTYDKQDRILREGLLSAGALRIAAYRVRDPETDEWGPRQYHMTYDNHVLALMGEESAKLFASFVNQNQQSTVEETE